MNTAKKQPIKENFGMVNQKFFLSKYPKIGLVLYNLTFSQNSLNSYLGSQHLMECIYVNSHEYSKKAIKENF